MVVSFFACIQIPIVKMCSCNINRQLPPIFTCKDATGTSEDGGFEEFLAEGIEMFQQVSGNRKEMPDFHFQDKKHLNEDSQALLLA